MRSWLLSSATAVVLFFGLQGAASACDQAKAQYRDNFESMDLLWGLPNDLKKVEGDAFQFTLQPRTLDFAVNQFGKLNDADICVQTTWKQGSQGEQTWSGIVFWASDDQNLYAFGVSPQGTVSIWRLIDNGWINPLRWTAHDGVKTGPGAVNKLRVQIRGDRATFFVNDDEVGSMRGAPPEGYFVGLIAEALEKSDPVVHAFDDFIVAAPADPAPAAPAPAAPAPAAPAPEPETSPPVVSAPQPDVAAPAPAAPAPADAAAPAPAAPADAPAPAQDAAKTEAESQQPGAIAQPAAETPKPADAPAEAAAKPGDTPPAAPAP